MQLIIECETDTEIRNINMSVINSENINEKFSSDNLLEKYSQNDSQINKQKDTNKTDDPKMITLENSTDVEINVSNDTTKDNCIRETEGSLNKISENKNNKELNNITKCLTEHPIKEKTDQHTLCDISDDNSLLHDESSQDKGKTETERNSVENLSEIMTTIHVKQDINVCSNGDEKENESDRYNTSSPICGNEEESLVCNEKKYLEVAKNISDNLKVDEDQESNAALAERNIEVSAILESGVSNVETLELGKELSNDQKSIIESKSCLDDKERTSDMTLLNSETESLQNKVNDQDQTKHEEVNIDKNHTLVKGSNIANSSKNENSTLNEDNKLLMITDKCNSTLTTQVTDKNDIDTIEMNNDTSQDDVCAKSTEKISNINIVELSIETRDDGKVDNITPPSQNSITNERTNDCVTNLPPSNEEVKPDMVSVRIKDSTREVSDVERGEDKSLNNIVPCNSIIEKNKEKQLPFNCELSKTLDFLSDDEDKKNKSNDDFEKIKQCNDLSDNDDILLINDEKISEESKNITNVIPQSDTKEITEIKKEQPDDKMELDSNIIPVKEDVKGSTDIVEKIGSEDTTEKVENEVKTPPPTKPLLPTNFLSMCKKNVSEMTRNDLEEFCLLKIVESIVDKGSIGDIKTKIKKMTSSLEEHKNKIKSLTKQNQDLQVVLRSVQEELRKNSPITPLKITRSVGIQVVMVEKSKQKAVSQQNTTSFPAKSNRPPSAVNKAKQHVGPIQQNIPVPRLIPAKNSTNNVQNQTPNNKVALNKLSPTSTRPTVQKPEKRSYTKSNSGSDTVDLTDDEPPNKIIPRPVNQTVRVVSPQNLMPPQRAQMVNSPRKVYIPIGGGAQVSNIRPATQTYMIKSLPTQNFRQRVPSLKRLHPAPLPESGKQYQAPNWKGIPPAPEIKLSKVENGIVISWKLDNYREDVHEDIASYQIYAYQETPSSPNTNLWKKIGDVKALPLPMACTLTQFVPGYKYYFAVRAVDIRSRQGNFSNPGNILLQIN